MLTNNLLKQRAKKLRSDQTEQEKKLWYHLRASRFQNRIFYRQFVIEPYIVDFVQRDLKLIIELDGVQHCEEKQKDEKRSKALEQQGYKVIRFWNNEVDENLDGVLDTHSLALSQRERELKAKTKIIPTFAPEYAKRRAYRNDSEHQAIWDILDNVYDPELPGLTIWDLGILQDVQVIDGKVIVTVTPTYSGCPAVDTINQDVEKALLDAGYEDVVLKITLAPAWSTEMMSPAGKAHLKSIHIAPPNEEDKIACPVCDSEDTKVISQFGSTACKSLCQCNDCSEVFDYFKHF
jgi:ring-1,2-phenylacetyl-CoA epoxidase subunit PaaD